jgi:hypothetical protein
MSLSRVIALFKSYGVALSRSRSIGKAQKTWYSLCGNHLGWIEHRKHARAGGRACLRQESGRYALGGTHAESLPSRNTTGVRADARRPDTFSDISKRV